MRTGRAYLQAMRRFFAPDWPWVICALCLLILGVVAGVLKPWPLALIIDSVLGGRPLPAQLASRLGGLGPEALLAFLAAAVLLAHFGQGALAAGQNYLLVRVGLQGLARVRETLFHCLLRLSMRFHHGQNQGDLIYRATWDTYAFQTLFHQGLFTLVTALFSLLLMVAVMARLNPVLTLAALGTVPPMLLVMRYFGRQMATHGVAAHAADGQVATSIQQGITALPLTLVCTREEHEERRFRNTVAGARTSRLSQHGWEILYLGLIALIFALGAACIVYVGARQVRQGLLTVGELLVFLAYLAQLHEPLNQLSHLGVVFSDASAGTSRVMEILQTPEDVVERPDARPLPGRRPAGASASAATTPLPEVRGDLSFERVCFGYRPGQPVLVEVTFTVPAGTALALTGASGAGKTTLLQLLPRFYDPASGTVRLDGADLRDLRLRDLRRQVAFVMQEPILLPGTVAENIAGARPGATPAEIQQAAAAAQADAFIRRLPQGYQTRVGEGAARLSAGERQRLELARAFLKDAPILVLDEPTSALDARSEQLVLAAVADLMRGRTTLLVTHRLASWPAIRRVAVLEAGRLMVEPAQGASQEGLAES